MKKNSWNKPLGAATSFALILSMTFGVSISSQDAAQAASKKPKLSSKKITVSVGKVKTIKVKPANKKVKWSSSNKKYATVSSSGKVKALKAGKGKKVKISAMATDGSGKKKSVTIKIK